MTTDNQSIVDDKIIQDEINKSLSTTKIIQVDESRPAIRDSKGRILPGYNLPKTPSAEIQAVKNLKNQILTKIAPDIIPVWYQLLHSKSEKIQVSAIKLAVETIFPKQMIHGMIGKIIHEFDNEDGGKVQGMFAALPAFGEYLKWKQTQDRDRIIDAQVVDAKPNVK